MCIGKVGAALSARSQKGKAVAGSGGTAGGTMEGNPLRGAAGLGTRRKAARLPLMPLFGLTNDGTPS